MSSLTSHGRRALAPLKRELAIYLAEETWIVTTAMSGETRHLYKLATRASNEKFTAGVVLNRHDNWSTVMRMDVKLSGHSYRLAKEHFAYLCL